MGSLTRTNCAESTDGGWPAAGGTWVRSIGWAAVDARDLRDLVRFDESPAGRGEDAKRERGGEPRESLRRPVRRTVDRNHDFVGVGRKGLGRKRLEQWETTLVPAGSELTITNATGEPAVVLLVAAPPPPKRAISE